VLCRGNRPGNIRSRRKGPPPGKPLYQGKIGNRKDNWETGGYELGTNPPRGASILVLREHRPVLPGRTWIDLSQHGKGLKCPPAKRVVASSSLKKAKNGSECLYKGEVIQQREGKACRGLPRGKGGDRGVIVSLKAGAAALRGGKLKGGKDVRTGGLRDRRSGRISSAKSIGGERGKYLEEV